MEINAATELFLTASAAAAVVRLWFLDLAIQFPILVSYLILMAGIDFGFGLLDQRSALYFWCYIVLEPVKCLLGVFAVRELFSLVFYDYPGIRQIGRWAMYAGVFLAVSVSLLLTGFFWEGAASGRAHSHLFYFELSQRSIVFSLAVVIITILVSLSRYPLHLSRNILVSNAFFSVIFLSEAARLLVDSLATRLNNRHVDWTENIFVAVCLLAWTILLRAEPRQSPAQIRFADPREDQLLKELNSLNQLMTRAARR